MPDIQSQEEFEHLHRDGVKNLELEKGRLAFAQSTHNMQTLDRGLSETLNSIFASLSGEGTSSPEAVFRKALKSLNEVEAKRFVLDNLLESVKRGEKIREVLVRYGTLGLLPVADSDHQVLDSEPLKTTRALLERKSIWERVATTVMQIGINGLKTLPKFVEIEPHVHVFPIPGLSFSLKAKGMSVYELFESLRDAQVAPAQPNG